MEDELKTERVQLFMSPGELRAIDDWLYQNRVRGRSEAIRQLVRLGLDASEKAAGRAAARKARKAKPGGAP